MDMSAYLAKCVVCDDEADYLDEDDGYELTTLCSICKYHVQEIEKSFALIKPEINNTVH